MLKKSKFGFITDQLKISLTIVLLSTADIQIFDEF
jgi:hypothetical protein